MPSPFPGMDPYLEDPARWPDVHLRLIAGLGDTLMAKVRPRYVVRADERVYVSEDGEPDGLIRPDLAVLAPRPEGRPAGGPAPSTLEAASVTVPTVMGLEHHERFLTIRARDSGEVVTVIEILSPTNKRGGASEGRQAYLAKRRQVLRSTAHLVEIDLLRGGARVPMARPLPEAHYYVIVSRADRRPDCDVFPLSLRDRLPTIPVPLRDEAPAPIDLQALLDSVYERAGYDLDLDYARAPIPPLGPEDSAWAAARVRERPQATP